jgi:hypothetical protein
MSRIAIYFGIRITAPIRRINPFGDITMKSRIRPIRYPLDVAMFQRIQMNIINMALIVGFVANQMLPIMALLDAPFPRGFSHV